MHSGLPTYNNTSIQKLCSVQRGIAATTVKLAITRHGLQAYFFSILPEVGSFLCSCISSKSCPSASLLVPTADLCCNLGRFFFWSPFSLSAAVGEWALAFHAPPPGTGRVKHEDEKRLEDLSSWWWIIVKMLRNLQLFTTLDPTSWIYWLHHVEHKAANQSSKCTFCPLCFPPLGMSLSSVA